MINKTFTDWMYHIGLESEIGWFLKLNIEYRIGRKNMIVSALPITDWEIIA